MTMVTAATAATTAVVQKAAEGKTSYYHGRAGMERKRDDRTSCRAIACWWLSLSVSWVSGSPVENFEM